MHSRYAVVSWACPVPFHHIRHVAGVLEWCFIGEDCWQAKLLPSHCQVVLSACGGCLDAVWGLTHS